MERKAEAVTGQKLKIGWFEIPGKLPSLNEVIAANRGNAYQGAKLKRDVERTICASIWEAVTAGKLPKHFDNRVEVFVTWVEGSNRRDADNVRSANKFILDALVKSGVLDNDSPKYVKDIHGRVFYPMDSHGNRPDPTVYVEIREVDT